MNAHMLVLQLPLMTIKTAHKHSSLASFQAYDTTQKSVQLQRGFAH